MTRFNYRYHFVVPVKDEPFADSRRKVLPDAKTDPLYVEMNVPQGSSSYPVIIPWSNIAYIEPIADDEH